MRSVHGASLVPTRRQTGSIPWRRLPSRAIDHVHPRLRRAGVILQCLGSVRRARGSCLRLRLFGRWNAGLRPYRTEDAAQVLAYQSTRGPAVGWTGYNEVAINPWGDDAIDAFFVVDCQPDEANHWLLPAILNRMHASNCAEAHENGRAAHAAFLRDHGVTAAEMPLLMLRRGDWYQPLALWT